ncbi:MAG: hypothetical protein QXE52_08325 [Candidatus Caldarchaeum sp.]
MAKPPEEEVRVSRQEMTIFPTPGRAERVYAITFITPDLGPRTIFMPVAQWSPEAEKKRIAEEIVKLRKGGMETFRIPRV